MKRAAALLALLAATLAHGAEPALVRTHLAAPGPVWVGQRATIVVELLVIGTFAGTPVLELPRLPGAILMEIAEPPVVGTEEIDGTSYTSQRRELGFWALQAGAFQIPAFSVRVTSSAMGEQRLTTEPVTIDARLPPGIERGDGLVSTTKLTMRDEWEPRPGDRAHVGDAFRRTVTRTAPDVPGMLFPPLPLETVDGVVAYPSPPEVRDRVERGDFTGERVDRITYVCEHAGAASIPELRTSWWNVDSRTIETGMLPAAALVVGGVARPRGGRWWLAAAIAAALLVSVAVVGFRSRRRGRDGSTEVDCFTRVEHACRAGDAPAAYNALVRWLDVQSGSRPATIALDLLSVHPDESLRTQVTALEDAVVRREPTWNGAPLAATLRRIRRAGLHHRRAVAPSLPPLNPC